MLHIVTLLIGVALMYSTPLIFGALGGVISERSGVVNIGIEGMMTVGAFVGALVGYYTSNPWMGLFCAGFAGMGISLLHAVASISFKADQIISGVAINLLGPGLSLFLCRMAFDGAVMSYPVKNKLPKIIEKGNSEILGNLNLDAAVLIALFVSILMWFILYRTKWGLRVCAIGENPAAADTLGINVYKTRYVCVLFSGILAGLGGGVMTLNIVSQFTPTSVAGQGFIALAAVVFGKWKPQGVFKACLIFGLAQAVTVVWGGGKAVIPTEIMAMVPYIMTIIILIFFVGKSVAPKADGIAYEKGRR